MNKIIKIKRVKSKQNNSSFKLNQISEPVRWTSAFGEDFTITSDLKKEDWTYRPIFKCKVDTKQFKVRIFSCFYVFELPDM